MLPIRIPCLLEKLSGTTVLTVNQQSGSQYALHLQLENGTGNGAVESRFEQSDRVGRVLAVKEHQDVSAQPGGLLLGERVGGPRSGLIVACLPARGHLERVAACYAEQRLPERANRIPPFLTSRQRPIRGVSQNQLGRKVVIGMIGSMTRQKIAITLPEEQVAAARQAVAEGRAASVSAYISQALARRTAEEEMAEIIAEIYAQAGQPTEEDRAWARRVLGVEP